MKLTLNIPEKYNKIVSEYETMEDVILNFLESEYQYIKNMEEEAKKENEYAKLMYENMISNCDIPF